MDYLNQKKNIPFEIQVFTAVENLIAYGKKTRIELLLISGRAMCREVRELDIGKIIILSEGVHSPELDTYPSVYKYQSSSDVIREVMECFLCADLRADTCERKSSALSESGRIFRV